MSQAQMGYRPLLNIYDLIDRVLDKGIVIDANVSVALVGIEILVIGPESSSQASTRSCAMHKPWAWRQRLALRLP